MPAPGENNNDELFNTADLIKGAENNAYSLDDILSEFGSVSAKETPAVQADETEIAAEEPAKAAGEQSVFEPQSDILYTVKPDGGRMEEQLKSFVGIADKDDDITGDETISVKPIDVETIDDEFEDSGDELPPQKSGKLRSIGRKLFSLDEEDDDPDDDFVPILERIKRKRSRYEDDPEPESSSPQNPTDSLDPLDASLPESFFREDIAKYFGPDAGFGQQIKNGEYIDDEDEDPIVGRRRRGIFRIFARRAYRQPEEDEPTEEEETEEPEPEPTVTPEEAAAALAGGMGRVRLWLLLAFTASAALVYLSLASILGLPMPDSFVYIKSPYRFLLASMILQSAVMLFCIDTTATGLRDLFRLKPGKESIVAVAAVASFLHAASIIVFPQWEGYYPYGAVSSLSLFFASYYRHCEVTARIKTYRTAAVLSKPYFVVCEREVYEGEDAYIKHRNADTKYFVQQAEKPDIATLSWRIAAPVLLAAAVILAIVATVGRGNSHRFLWSFSAIITPAAGFTACMSFSRPFHRIAKRFAALGEAVAGWSAAEELSSGSHLIASDSDIFPSGSIRLNRILLYSDYEADKVISYTVSLIKASGSAGSILEMLEERALPNVLRHVNNLRFYENGGVGGLVGGDSVQIGSASFMLRSGIKLPEGGYTQNVLYVAINQELAGMFAMDYAPRSSVKKAIKLLYSNAINPVFAVRDFNVTKELIESLFGVSTDTTDFPRIEDRLALSDPDREYSAKPVAVIGREGLARFAEVVVCAGKLRRSTLASLMLTFAGAVIGMLLMFYFMYTHAASAASPLNLLLYGLVWFAANWLVTSRT